MSNSPYEKARQPNQSIYFRAQANMTYLEFLQIVGYWWNESHPDVRMYITSTDKTMSINLANDYTSPTNVADGYGVDPGIDQDMYPRIVAALDIRKPMQMEPKPKFREEIMTEDDEDTTIEIKGQRFLNIVTFTVVDRIKTNYPVDSPCTDPEYFRENVLECTKYDMVSSVDEIVEVFEDFMLEVTPALKQLGVSELVYGRRLPDTADTRGGRGVVKRAVSYMITTEKLTKTAPWKIKKLVIDARKYLESATPTIKSFPNITNVITDLHSNS